MASRAKRVIKNGQSKSFGKKVKPCKGKIEQQEKEEPKFSLMLALGMVVVVYLLVAGKILAILQGTSIVNLMMYLVGLALTLWVVVSKKADFSIFVKMVVVACIWLVLINL